MWLLPEDRGSCHFLVCLMGTAMSILLQILVLCLWTQPQEAVHRNKLTALSDGTVTSCYRRNSFTSQASDKTGMMGKAVYLLPAGLITTGLLQSFPPGLPCCRLPCGSQSHPRLPWLFTDSHLHCSQRAQYRRHSTRGSL